MTAVVGAATVGLLPMVLAVCSSPANEHGSLSAETRIEAAAMGDLAEAKGLPGVGREAAEGPSNEPAPAGSDKARAVKVRRIEDLPLASPVAFRPLRVDELPEASPVAGRARRGKEGALAGGDETRSGAAKAKEPGRALRVEDLPSVSAAVRLLRADELNPELVRRADDLLWNHRAPVGTDIPLEVNGKSYVARFAIHYHEFGSAQKPWGYHKGVTLYATEP